MTKYDIVIFGATGFTGKKVVEEIAQGGVKYAGITWAVAGRSESKLLRILKDVSSKTGVDLSNIKIITADVGDYQSLKIMCSQARVVLNCCGPYRLYGEPVVQASIEAKSHYVDVSGEEDFIGMMQMKYDEEARKAGVYVISACGFDSIPNDMGVVFLDKNFGGILNSVESYLSIKTNEKFHKEAQKCGILNFGTWESAVYVFANFFSLLSLRKKLYPNPLPAFKPKLCRRFPLHMHNGKWAVPLPSPDGPIVYRTQRRLYELTKKRPVQFQPYIALPSIYYVLLLSVVSIFTGILSRFKIGRDLLLKNPRWFTFGFVSKQGPTQVVMENTEFLMEMVGRGWEAGQDVEASVPRKTVIVKISGKDPAYGFTSLALMQSALVILKEIKKMPSTGGVITSGAAFWDTSFIAKLQENNVKFQIVQ